MRLYPEDCEWGTRLYNLDTGEELKNVLWVDMAWAEYGQAIDIGDGQILTDEQGEIACVVQRGNVLELRAPSGETLRTMLRR
jgi:hypothetical protein